MNELMDETNVFHSLQDAQAGDINLLLLAG